MTKIINPFTVSLLLIGTAFHCHADTLCEECVSQDGFYTGVLVGAAILDNHKASSGAWQAKSDGGATLGVFGGYRFTNVFETVTLRTEIELSGLSIKLDRGDYNDGSLHQSTVFWNSFVEFEALLPPRVSPYLGMGIGYGKLEFDNYQFTSGERLDDSDQVWGAQLIGGATYKATEQLSIFADARYRHWDKAAVIDSNNVKQHIDIDQAQFNIGAIFRF